MVPKQTPSHPSASPEPQGDSSRDRAKEGRAFASRCVSVDLEVGVKDRRLHRFAAVRGDTGEAVTFGGGRLAAALARLEELAASLIGNERRLRSVRAWEVVVPELVFEARPGRSDTLQNEFKALQCRAGKRHSLKALSA